MSFDTSEKIFSLMTMLAGAAMGVIGKAYFDARGRGRKQLEIAITEPVRLIFYSQPIAERVEIKVDGHPVRTLANSEVRLRNSGTQVLNDVRIQIELEGTAELIAAEPLNTALHIEGLVTQAHVKNVDIRAGFINPNEEIGVRLLTTNSDFRPKVHFRQLEVSHIVRKDDSPELLNPLGMIFFNAVRQRPLMSFCLARTDLSYRRFLLSENCKLLTGRPEEPAG